MWEEWLHAAEESLAGARLCENQSPRSAASRYYYAAYQAATALLHYLEVDPPGQAPDDAGDREAWSHVATPVILERHLEKIEKSRANRRKLREFLRILYRVRLDADYHPGLPIGKLDTSRKAAESLVKYAREVLVEGRTSESKNRGRKRK